MEQLAAAVSEQLRGPGFSVIVRPKEILDVIRQLCRPEHHMSDCMINL